MLICTKLDIFPSRKISELCIGTSFRRHQAEMPETRRNRLMPIVSNWALSVNSRKNGMVKGSGFTVQKLKERLIQGF